MDQPLPAIAKEIQWLWPDSFSNNKYVIKIGERGKGRGSSCWDGRENGWMVLGGQVQSQLLEQCCRIFCESIYLVRTRHAHQVTAAALLILQQSKLNWKENIYSMLQQSKLNWKENIYSMLKNVNSRMYGMRKLRSFGVNSDMLVTFYNAVICSMIMFGSVCWGGNISKLDRGRLKKIVKKSRSCCSKATGLF